MTAHHGHAAGARVDELRSALPPSRVLVDPARTAAYASDWSGIAAGSPSAVVLAETTHDVVVALRWANHHGVPTTLRGGGSGVSGGAVAYDGGLVVSTARMNRILDLSPVDRIAVVEPGVLIAHLDRAAGAHGLMYAPDPVSKDIATIGGSIATNAGGLRCLAHGVTSEAVSGLEVVLPDGRVLHTGGRTRKSATGYDLTHLFVGSEGSLGVITQATVRLTPLPRGERVTFAATFPSAQAAGAAVAGLLGRGLDLELPELLDHSTLEFVRRHLAGAGPTDGAMPDGAMPDGAMPDGGTVRDGGAMLVGMVIAVDAAAQLVEARAAATDAGAVHFEASQGTGMLDVRARVKEALMAGGLEASCDAAVPPSRLAELLAAIDVIAARDGRVVATVAHAGDGNIHAAVQSRDEPDDAEAVQRVLRDIVRAALALDGVVTGEHGIGAAKVHLVAEQFTPDTLAVQHAIRELLDPRGILNPGRVI